MRRGIIMRPFTLFVLILFTISNITYAAPANYPALRQPSTAVSPKAAAVYSAIIDTSQVADATSTISSARKLFREGERIWRKAKNCPDRSQVEGLANQAIERFEEAKEILDTLPLKDINAKRLLQLIAGDRPKERTGGHISRAKKTVIESAKLVDLYNERGTRDKTAGRPTAQYLHADPKGLIHATIGFFMFTPDGDIVFQRRAPDKVFFPNMLTLAACGHPDRTKKGEIKDIFTATKDEARGETGIPRIYGKRIRKIGHPDKIKDAYKYDQRVDFIAYEFVATDQKEAEELRRISEEINERERKTSKSVFDRLICNYNEEIWTLTLYTFGWDKKDVIEEQAKEIIQKTGVPIGDVNYNREVKSLYAYVATEEEMGILKTKKTEHKEEEIAKFEIDTRSIEEIAKDFQNNPEKYPDTFIPTLTDPDIVKQLVDIQCELRMKQNSPGHYNSAAEAEVITDLKKNYLSKIPPASESTIKMIIFDWGKVLDTYDYRIAAKILVERFGIDEDLANRFFEERNTNPGNPLYRYEHNMIDEEGLREETNKWLRQVGAGGADLKQDKIEQVYTSPRIDDIPETLALVQVLVEKGYKIKILTTTSNLFHRCRLRDSRLIQLLPNGEKDIFASHLTGVAKPDMESYLQAVRHAGVEAEQALYVDDMQYCIDGAKRAGLRTYLFNPKDVLGSVKDIYFDLIAARDLKQYLDAIPPASESPIKLVIFDQGNVVTLYDYQKVAEELHTRFGIDKKIALDFCEERNSDPDNPIYKYEHKKIDEEQLVAEVKQWLEDNLHKRIELTQQDWEHIFNTDWVGNIPETVSLIRVLKARGYEIRGLATISGMHYNYMADPNNRIGLALLLDDPEKDFYASCHRKYAKPHPQSYLDVVEEAGVSPGQALFIDDRQDCVAGAVRAGLMACLFFPLNPTLSIRDIVNDLVYAHSLSEEPVDRKTAKALLEKEDLEFKTFAWKHNMAHSERMGKLMPPRSISFRRLTDGKKASIRDDAYIFDLTKVKTKRELLNLYWDTVEAFLLDYVIAYYEKVLLEESKSSDSKQKHDKYCEEIHRHFISKLEIKPNEVILDLGTGMSAALALAAAPYANKVHAVDVSAKVIMHAEKRATEKGARNIIFLHINGTKLPFGNGAVDRVVVSQCFCHFPNKIRFRMLSEIRRVLKPGGKINFREYFRPFPPVDWNKVEWLKYLPKFGFADIECRICPLELYDRYYDKRPDEILLPPNILFESDIFVSARKVPTVTAEAKKSIRFSSAGLSAVPDEGVSRIVDAVRGKVIHTCIMEGGIMHKDRKMLSEFGRMQDLVMTVVRAARAHSNNLTDTIAMQEVLGYIEKATVWEGKGSGSIGSIKEDEQVYLAAQAMIVSLAEMYRSVGDARAYVEATIEQGDGISNAVLLELDKFIPQTPMSWVARFVKRENVHDSAFLCGLPVPEVRTVDEYVEELLKRLELPLAGMHMLKNNFAGHIRAALAGLPRYFDIYKSFLGTPTGKERGRFLRLEVGGSNIYISVADLKESGEYEILTELKFEIPNEKKVGKGTDYFDYIAYCIAKFLEKYEKEHNPSDRYKTGFVFSFALKKTDIDKSILVETSKQYRLEGVIGEDPIRLLKEALARKGIAGKIDIKAIGNDTEALQAGATYKYADSMESLILSTGYNIPVLTQGDIFNTEAGSWKDPYFLRRMTQFDMAIDESSLNKGGYVVEKELSGYYVGEVARRILNDMISRGLLFGGESCPVFENPWQFTAKHMDGIEKHSLQDIMPVREFLESLGIKDVTDKDAEAVWKVCDMVTTRAARLVATALATAVTITEGSPIAVKRKHLIPAEGSFYELHPTIRQKIDDGLHEMFGDDASKISLVIDREVTKIGGAVMAAMAEKVKSSSAGNSSSVREILKPSDSPIIFNVTSMPIPNPKLSDYTDFRESLLKKKGFYPFSFVENYIVYRDGKGQEYVLKPDASNEALAYYLAKAVGFKDIGKVLLFIAPDGMYVSGLKSYALIEYYNGITFSATDRHFPRIEIDSELYKQHQELRDLTLKGIDFDAWSKVLADPAQMARSDLFRIFTHNPESTWVRNLLYKELDNDKVEMRFIDYQPAFTEDGFEEKEIISHLKKYGYYYLKYCPELLMNIVNLSDEDIEYIVKWVYRQELLDVRIGIENPAGLIENIKRSRDLIKETLGDEIAKIESTAKTADDKDIKQKTNLVYALPEVVTVKNKQLRIVPLTPQLMIKEADEFFILQNSVAADVVWSKERDVIGVAKGRKDGPIQFAPELNCSFAVLDENDVPVAVAMYSSADKRKGYAYLETFAVLPEYQGTGIASWILLYSFQEAKKQGFTHASWITREELDEIEKAHSYQRYSARAIPYYEIKVNAKCDEKKGENGRIPPKEQTGDNVGLAWDIRPGKWHIAYCKDLSDISSLYADFKAKSALCTISDRVDTAIRVNTAIDAAA